MFCIRKSGRLQSWKYNRIWPVKRSIDKLDICIHKCNRPIWQWAGQCIEPQCTILVKFDNTTDVRWRLRRKCAAKGSMWTFMARQYIAQTTAGTCSPSNSVDNITSSVQYKTSHWDTLVGANIKDTAVLINAAPQLSNLRFFWQCEWTWIQGVQLIIMMTMAKHYYATCHNGNSSKQMIAESNTVRTYYCYSYDCDADASQMPRYIIFCNHLFAWIPYDRLHNNAWPLSSYNQLTPWIHVHSHCQRTSSCSIEVQH